MRARAKSPRVAWILWACLGPFGAHRFYLGDPIWGLVYAGTGGLFALGWFADAFTLADKIERANAGSPLAPARLVSRGS